MAQGVCRCLVALCGSLKDNVLNSYAAGALANLAIHEDGRGTMVQEGAISPLVQFCLRSGDNTVIGYAALALARLAVTERASLGNVVGGGNAFYALIRAQQTLGQEIAPYLMQPIAGNMPRPLTTHVMHCHSPSLSTYCGPYVYCQMQSLHSRPSQPTHKAKMQRNSKMTARTIYA